MNPHSGVWCYLVRRPRGLLGGLVAAGGVQSEFVQEFAGGGVDDAGVQVLDQEEDEGPGAAMPRITTNSERGGYGAILLSSHESLRSVA
jgi:hypothetical protein